MIKYPNFNLIPKDYQEFEYDFPFEFIKIP